MSDGTTTPNPAVTEAMAKAIYEHRDFAIEHSEAANKPAWQERGNSIMQNRARDFARAALSAPQAVGDERAAVLAYIKRIAPEDGWGFLPQLVEAIELDLHHAQFGRERGEHLSSSAEPSAREAHLADVRSKMTKGEHNTFPAEQLDKDVMGELVEAIEHLDWIASISDMFFAECSQAEEVVERAAKARNRILAALRQGGGEHG